LMPAELYLPDAAERIGANLELAKIVDHLD
jgi:hypothetical protein